MKKMIQLLPGWIQRFAAGAFAFFFLLTGCQITEGDLFGGKDTGTENGTQEDAINSTSDNVFGCPEGATWKDGRCVTTPSTDSTLSTEEENTEDNQTIPDTTTPDSETENIADSDYSEMDTASGGCRLGATSFHNPCENGFHHIDFSCENSIEFVKGSDDICLSVSELIDIAIAACAEAGADGVCTPASIDTSVDSEDTDMPTDTAEIGDTDLFIPINPADTAGLAEIGDGGLSGVMKRYWDCCKPSCAWETANYTNPALTCSRDNSFLENAQDAQSACSGGDVYACWSLSPWQVNTRLAYGFARATVEADAAVGGINCGECIQMEFEGDLEGKTMVVQIVETGADIGNVAIQLMVPGGGMEVFNACTQQWGTSVLGAQYGGFLTECINSHTTPMAAASCVAEMCESVFDGKDDLKNGCLWSLGWLYAQDSPAMRWQKIECPEALTSVGGMQ